MTGLVLVWASCQSHRNSKATASIQPADTELSDEDFENRVKALAAFSTGVVLQEREEPDAAYAQFARAAENDPANEALATEVARHYLQKNQTASALAVLQRTASQPDASGVIQALLADTLWQSGQGDAAIKAYQSAVQATPTLLAAYQQLAVIFLNRAQTNQALGALDQSLSVASDDPTYWLNDGDLFSWFGRAAPTEKAAAHAGLRKALDQAASLKPKEPAELLRLGRGFLELGENSKAEALFEQAQDLLPKNPAVAASMAEVLIRDGRLKEAREHLELLSRANPTSHFPWYFLGVLDLEEKHEVEAERMFERAVQLNPDFEPAYSDWAVAYLNRNEPARALTVLQRGLDRFPTSFRLVYLKAMAEARNKDYDKSFAAFKLAESIARDSSPELLDYRFYFQVGATLEQGGREAESVQYLEKALELKPDFDEALNHLGYMWAEQGKNLDRAHEMIQRAVEAEPENPAYLDSLGWVLFKQGKAAEALPWLEKAAKLLPEPDATVYDHLGDVLQALGRKSEAKQAWEKSLAVEASEVVKKKVEAE